MSASTSAPVIERPFVGRKDELAAVSGWLRAAAEATPQIIVVDGEAGIGKTAFLRQCVSAATAAAFVVLEVTAEETEANLDLGLVSQLASRARALAVGGEFAATALETDPAVGPFAVGARLLQLLGSLQDGGPLLAVIDDAQWIDAASAAALLFAVRRLSADRLCLLVGTRPQLAGLRESGWLRLLHDGERVRRLTLSGLSVSEVSLLADRLGHAPLSARSAECLRHHTSGHPLYLKTLLSELPADALAAQPPTLPAPRSFAVTVLVRLAAVSSAAQELVAAATVAGTRTPLMLVATAAGVADPFALLDEAVDADLLAVVPGSAPIEIVTPHPLVRAAIYDDLSFTRRRRLHLAFAALGSERAALEHRVAASPGADDALADDLAKAGEADIAAGRLHAGIDRLLSASRIAASIDRRELLLLHAMNYLGHAGQARRALALRDDVAACRDSPLRSFILAVVAASAGQVDESLAGLRVVPEHPDYDRYPLLAQLVPASLAIVSAYAGRCEDAVAFARQVSDDPETPATIRLTARQSLALGLAVGGRLTEAIAVLADVASPPVSSAPLDAELLVQRGTLKVWSGDLRGGMDDLLAVIQAPVVHAGVRSLADGYCSLAEAEYHLGSWDESVAHAELAITLAADNDQIWELPRAHAVASLVCAGRGDEAIAMGHVDTAQRAAVRARLPLGMFYACLAAAHRAAMVGDPDGVLVALARLRDEGPAPAAAVLARRAWPLEAEALIASGCLDEAQRVLAGAGERLTGVEAVDLYRLRGVLAHARGDSAAARKSFAAGVQAAGAASSRFAEARLELAHGRWLRRAGRRSAAAARLRVAAEHLERLGAAPLLRHCRDELAGCGVGPRPSAAGGYGLSAREQIVARLVMAGKTNREVGGELYLSTKAIEYHLANIYAKVGVRSRRELTSRLGHLL
jgi:ATP/maltotriose-dependent transcriptional regulator MalT